MTKYSETNQGCLSRETYCVQRGGFQHDKYVHHLQIDLWTSYTSHNNLSFFADVDKSFLKFVETHRTPTE